MQNLPKSMQNKKQKDKYSVIDELILEKQAQPKESWQDDFIKHFGHKDEGLGMVILAEDPSEVFLWIEEFVKQERKKIIKEIDKVYKKEHGINNWKDLRELIKGL